MLKNNGQADKETIEDIMKRKKAKEREKRIREFNNNDEFELDEETETVIKMTNRNNEKKQKAKNIKISKKQMKRKRLFRKIKFIFKLIILIGLIVGAIVFALTSPVFNIKEIKVENNSKIPSDTIISLSELKIEENIFKFNKSSTIEKIKENPYIESVNIRRKIPSTIEINIEERVAKFSIEYVGKFVLINTQGYLLEISDTNQNLPIIKGSKTNEEEIQLGNRLNNDDLEILSDVIKIFNTANDNGIAEKITSIDISDKNDYIIYLQEEKKTIHLGDNTNLSNKMLNAAAIMEQEKGIEGDIFVNGDLNNKFKPYFRQKV